MPLKLSLQHCCDLHSNFSRVKRGRCAVNKHKDKSYGKAGDQREPLCEWRGYGSLPCPEALIPSDNIQPCCVSYSHLHDCTYVAVCIGLSHEEERSICCDKQTLVHYPGTRCPRRLWCESAHDLRHKRTVPSILGLPRKAGMMFLSLLKRLPRGHPGGPRQASSPTQLPKAEMWELL